MTDPVRRHPARSEDDVHASILLDLARAVQVAPRMLPEHFGPGGRYRLEELIGIGRDSHVYRAVDTHLSKPHLPARVAVKIRASGSSTRTEALVGRSVVHDNVVRVIDHGVDDAGEYYIVQEWIEGGDLTQLEVPLPAREAVRLAIQIARGIQALHSAGNIHGDLKPSNILRTLDGTPKITDFDLASAPDLEEYRRGGNLAFMSPEILLEEDVLASPLGDIYSLGGLLYYFLTGRLPHGDEPQEIVRHHRRGEPVDLSGLESDLARICGRALAASPGDRYRSAEALADDLERWLGRYPIDWVRPSLARRAWLLCRRRPVPLTIGALIVLALVTTAVMLQVIVNRNIDAQRRALAISQAEMDAFQARGRSTIEQFVASGVLGNKTSRGPSIFTALAWVDWVADRSVLGDRGPTLSREERIAGLSQMREYMKSEGQVGSLADSIAAYALAYSYIEQKDYGLAIQAIEDARAGALGKLAENDSTTRSLNTLRDLADYGTASAAGDPLAGVLRARLERAEVELRNFDSRHSVADLIRLVLERGG